MSGATSGEKSGATSGEKSGATSGATSGEKSGVRIERVTGAAMRPHLGAVAALRIAVFEEYPYLYRGDLAYEERYLAPYAASDAGLVVLALDGDRVVGASTALPLADHLDELAPALARAGYPAADVYYFGESVLERAYRGRGIGRAFLAERERRARELGFRVAAFCAVQRPADHPRRPAGYRGNDALWTGCGFVRRPDIVAEMSWRDLDEDAESPKPMLFWLKELA